MKESRTPVIVRMFALRPRLAWRLAGVALVGIGTVASLAVLAFAIMVLAFSRSWEALNEGLPLTAGGWSLLAVICGISSGRMVFLFGLSPSPAGVRVPRLAADAFYQLVDDLARRIGAARIDRVWVTGDMNAMVMQRPRWGWVGPIETHLMIGLPLVHSVSRSQLAAVLAHEFAHLALQRHGVGAVGAHLRAWWMRVLDRGCEAFPSIGGWLDQRLRPFYRDMLRLTRIEEFEADHIAARLVGAGLLGETLVELSLKERFLRQDYWPKVMAQSSAQARPSIRPFREMGLGVETGFSRLSLAALDIAAFAEEAPEMLPFHPSLKERLRALRVPLRAAVADRPSAARHYFAPLLPSLAWVFDRAWWLEVRKAWRSQQSRQDGV
ncbi:hypothetical protein CJ010_21330 [Azoarcus sp. DD4]|uniref:M48 family metallopeptidase n=1 Tax=Azoarcus sp. DD4 TaxID=2027405 RepID=UPI001125E95F|nr:M48 family metallopeptidase [Azoarcus sp. DD4]QDF98898.1 hypothetical protein CJ010_21330 [Azoarcus sp. DD4]